VILLEIDKEPSLLVSRKTLRKNMIVSLIFIIVGMIFLLLFIYFIPYIDTIKSIVAISLFSWVTLYGLISIIFYFMNYKVMCGMWSLKKDTFDKDIEIGKKIRNIWSIIFIILCVIAVISFPEIMEY